MAALEPVYGRVEHSSQEEGNDEPAYEGLDLPDQEESAKHHGCSQEGYGHRAHHLSRRGSCPTTLTGHGCIRCRRCRFRSRLGICLHVPICCISVLHVCISYC